jgi:hypothetical protein
MQTVTVLMTTPEGDIDSVAVPVDAWEAALCVPKANRQEFLLAQLHRAPQPCAPPSRSLVRPHDMVSDKAPN